MAVIYQAKILLKTGSGYPGVVLDYGEAGYDGSANKFYIGNGVGNAPTGITMDASFNFLANIVAELEASTGNYATQTYVDGSLNFIRSTYIPDSSLSNDFIWNGSFLEVSLGAVAGLDQYATNASVNLYATKTDASISFIKAVFIPDVSLGDNFYWDATNLLNTQTLKGTVYPVSPSEGAIFYRTDNGLQFVYDGSRGKYLSTSRQTLNGGRATAVAGTTVYMRVGDATQSSTTGFKMFRNGTITGFSVDNNNTLTAARTIQIRVNDSVVTSSIIGIGSKSTYTNQANSDFNAGDVIQISALAGSTGSALANWIVVVEIAWRS